MAGTLAISYTNNYAPRRLGLPGQPFVDKGVAITLGKQNRDSISRDMTMD